MNPMNDSLLKSLAAAVAEFPDDVYIQAAYADRLAEVGCTDDSGSDAAENRAAYTTESPRRIVGWQPHGQGDGPIYARDE